MNLAKALSTNVSQMNKHRAEKDIRYDRKYIELSYCTITRNILM